MDQIEELEKNYVIRDNYYVFEKLLNNSLIKEELSNFFVKKYIIIFNYKKNGSTNYDDLKFIQKIKSKLTDNLDFEYHFFNFILERFNNFILALGYKSNYIKNYFSKKIDKKRIRLIYTGKDTKTGGRLLRLKDILKKEKIFMLRKKNNKITTKTKILKES